MHHHGHELDRERFIDYAVDTTYVQARQSRPGVKGAVDGLDLVLKTLEKAAYNEDRLYIHVDSALFGLVMPYLKRVLILTCDYCNGMNFSCCWFATATITLCAHSNVVSVNEY